MTKTRSEKQRSGKRKRKTRQWQTTERKPSQTKITRLLENPDFYKKEMAMGFGLDFGFVGPEFIQIIGAASVGACGIHHKDIETTDSGRHIITLTVAHTYVDVRVF